MHFRLVLRLSQRAKCVLGGLDRCGSCGTSRWDQYCGIGMVFILASTYIAWRGGESTCKLARKLRIISSVYLGKR